MARETHFGHQIVPSLLARDLPATIEYYVNVLGFTLSGLHPRSGKPEWAELKRDGVALQFFAEAPAGLPRTPVLSGTIYFYPSSVDDLANELEGRVKFEWGPELMSYGMREFGIRDPNGYFLAFAEPA